MATGTADQSIGMISVLSSFHKQADMAVPSDDEEEELLLSCRYGDLEDIQQFVIKFGEEAVSRIKDDNGNTVLHMTAANGHEGKHSVYKGRSLISTRSS